jgi:DNA polymerase V
MRFPLPDIGNQEDKSFLPTRDTPNSFQYIIEDDSMLNAHAPIGAAVHVDPNIKIETGQIVLASLKGQYHVRRLVKTRKCLVLHPENPAYKPIVITKEMNFKVCGVVTSITIQLIQ